MAIGAGEFQGQLIIRAEMPPAGEIPAHQRARPRSDDVFISRIVAAAAKHRRLHVGKNIALKRTRLGARFGRIQRCIGQFCRAANIDDLGRRLDQSQAGNQPGCVFKIGKPVHGRAQLVAVGRGQPIGIPLNPNLAPSLPQAAQHFAQFYRRHRRRPIDPNPDVINNRGKPRLQQIRRPRQQRQPSIIGQHQTLKINIAKRVVPGQPIHALLAEHQQRRNPLRPHRRNRCGLTCSELVQPEMKMADHVGRSRLALISLLGNGWPTMSCAMRAHSTIAGRSIPVSIPIWWHTNTTSSVQTLPAAP